MAKKGKKITVKGGKFVKATKMGGKIKVVKGAKVDNTEKKFPDSKFPTKKGAKKGKMPAGLFAFLNKKKKGKKA